MVSIVCLRFYVRGVMIRSIGWDDWVVLASAVGSPSCLAHVRFDLHLFLHSFMLRL